MKHHINDKEYKFVAVLNGAHGEEVYEMTIWCETAECAMHCGKSAVSNPVTGTKGDLKYCGVFCNGELQRA